MLRQENLNQYENTKQLHRSVKTPNLRYNDSGWTIKQILGHMIDSCSMNHQRIGRRKQNAEVSLPGYDQDSFVLNMRYTEMEFAEMLLLWESHNNILLKVFSLLTESDLDNSTFTLKDGTGKPYRWWIDSYFEHMQKHEKQVSRILKASNSHE